MREQIEYMPYVRTNVSERRADFYRVLPGRIETGYMSHEPATRGCRYLAAKVGIGIGLLVAWAAFGLR